MFGFKRKVLDKKTIDSLFRNILGDSNEPEMISAPLIDFIKSQKSPFQEEKKCEVEKIQDGILAHLNEIETKIKLLADAMGKSFKTKSAIPETLVLVDNSIKNSTLPNMATVETSTPPCKPEEY